MVLNTWWDGDPEQRYWMEVATTGAMGTMLLAPRFLGAAWSYELVGQVQPGDRVLHWDSTSGHRGLVGWSVVTASPEVVPEYTWQPRGTAGRTLAGPRTTEGWKVTLGGLNEFEMPVLSEELQERRQAVLDVSASVQAAHGRPTYFPFYLYGGNALRAQQGYLVKFPSQLFEVFPSLDAARMEASNEPNGYFAEDGRKSGQEVPKGNVTRIQDPELRSAIENHAVDRAIEYYAHAGGYNFVKLGKPYDIKLTLDGEERHVEVKGSSLSISTVELTINEVKHAGAFQPTDLIVVDGIDYQRSPTGVLSTSGGRLRVWSDWAPLDEDLTARKFAYSLPGAPK